MLLQIVYVSAATAMKPGPEIENMLAKARLRNHEDAITGLLVHRDGAFFHVIEGEDSHAGALFNRISRDTRHRRVLKLHERRIAHRMFPDWAMGFGDATGDHLAELDPRAVVEKLRFDQSGFNLDRHLKSLLETFALVNG